MRMTISLEDAIAKHRETMYLTDNGAACSDGAASHLDAFYCDDSDKKAERAAKALCEVCPVRQECLDYSIKNNELYGIWGGKTLSERDSLRRRERARRAARRSRL